MLNNLNLERLQTFVVAARAPTFAEAARLRGVSVSAISQQVKALEAQLSQPLFERVGRRVRLTSDGRALLQVASEHLGALDEAVKKLTATRTQVDGTVSLGSPRTFGKRWLEPRLPRLLERFPSLSVRLELDVPTVLEARLHEGALDFAILVRPHQRSGLLSSVLEQERFVAVCAPALLRSTAPLDAKALALERWLVFDADRPMHDKWWRATFAVAPPQLTPVAFVPSLELLAGLAERGAGLVVLPEYVVHDALEAGRLVLVPVTARRASLNSLFLCWRRSLVDSARLDAVRAALLSTSVAGQHALVAATGARARR